MTTVDTTSTRSFWTAQAAERASVWAHYATLAVGFVALLLLGREQWFYFDEWDIIWPAEAARRFVEGHNGHWSAVPITIWTILQNTLGLSSYLPYLGVAIIAHLVTAHLLWRILRRAGSSAWIATLLITVFIFFGGAAENLMWAFQLGFMGAIAFGLGAVIISMRPTLTPFGIVAIVALLALGSATAGTVLPFFATIAIIVLVRWGWLRALLCVGPPAVVYMTWFVFFAGPNPAAIYRASGIGNSLQGIPEFVATMFVEGYESTTPVPGFGLIIVIAIAAWALWALRMPARAASNIAVLGLISAGLIFAILTAYSRLGTGLDAAAEPRYVYLIVVATLPSIALLLTWLGRTSRLRLIVTVGLIGVMLIYNTGTLLTSARGAAQIEVRTHELISAALDLADAHPGAIDPASRPDPVYLPRNLEQLQSLEVQFGLPRVSYTEADRLAALTNISLEVEPVAAGSDQTCDTPLAPGVPFTVDPAGAHLRSVNGGDLTVTPIAADVAGDARTLPLPQGDSALTIVEPTTFVVGSVTAPMFLCSP